MDRYDSPRCSREHLGPHRLARDRGEDMGALAIGPLRIKNHDGLLSMFEGGRLGDDPKRNQARFDVGLDSRELVEARTGDLRSQLGNDSAGGSGHNNDRFVWARHDRAKACNMVAQIDIAVAMECRDEPVALQMLRWVARQGHAISAFGKGRAFARHPDALVRALDVAERVIGGR